MSERLPSDTGPGSEARSGLDPHPGLDPRPGSEARRPLLAWAASLARPARGLLLLAIVAGVGAAVAAVGLTATSAWLISRAAERPPVLALMVAIVGVRAFGIGRGALRYAERLVSHDAAFRVLAGVRSTAYRRLERLAPAGLAELRSGDLVARLVVDIDGLADVWLRVLQPYVVAAIVGAGAVVLVAALVPAAGLALAVTLLGVAIGGPVAARAVAAAAERRIAPARGAVAGAALELLRGAPELVVHGASEARLADLAGLDARLRAAEARSARGSGAGALVAGIGAGLAVWLALVAGIVAVRAGTLGGVALAVVVLTPIAAHELVAGLSPAAQQLPRLRAAAGRVTEVLERPDPVREPDAPAALPRAPYGIRIRGLRARYTPSGPEVLRGINLDVPAGGRLLVTGASGAGKTTLAAVLLRFLEPSAGRVELVGADGSVGLDAISDDDLRRTIGVCAQDVHVFDTTILDNVRLARPRAGEHEVAAALRAARLDGWIATLPDGAETLVGEHGARLSGGQRQRLGLARALLADPPILVFDEPTEHLDEATASALVDDLLAATAGRTAVFITHRPELMGAVLAEGIVRLELGPSGATLAMPEDGATPQDLATPAAVEAPRPVLSARAGR